MKHTALRNQMDVVMEALGLRGRTVIKISDPLASDPNMPAPDPKSANVLEEHARETAAKEAADAAQRIKDAASKTPEQIAEELRSTLSNRR